MACIFSARRAHPSAPAAPRHRLLQTSGAFTLIELLVVISIIALLIAILLPALTMARQTAVATQCASQIRSLGLAAELYSVDNEGYTPPMQYVLPSGPTWFWYDHLFQYIGRKNGNAGRFPTGQKEDNPWWCPAEEIGNPVGYPYTYGINQICGFRAYVRKEDRHMASTIERNPSGLSDTVWFADMDYGPYFSGHSAESANVANSVRTFDWRHLEQANAVFMDGHVERVEDPGFFDDPGLLLTPEWQRFFGTLPN